MGEGFGERVGVDQGAAAAVAVAPAGVPLDTGRRGPGRGAPGHGSGLQSSPTGLLRAL